MKKESRTEFVNRVMGLSFKSTQGKYSYCNDERKKVLFSLDNDNDDVILSPEWSRRGYAHSLNHIKKIQESGYDLLVFKTRTKTRANGETIADGFQPVLEKRTLVVEGKLFKAKPIDYIATEEVHESGSRYFEGSKTTIVVNKYERNQAARQACLDEFGYICRICDFDFEKKYGDRGREFIHVHHIVPLSEINKGYELQPHKDLVPVCPNCHAMLHRGGHTLLPEELKKIVNQKSS